METRDSSSSDRRSFMNRLLTGSLVVVGLSAVGGCGGSTENEVMIPTDPKDFPENKAKASMDFYREKMLKDKKKGGRRN